MSSVSGTWGLQARMPASVPNDNGTPTSWPRVLVVGPFSAIGGMGAVCRAMLGGEKGDAARFRSGTWRVGEGGARKRPASPFSSWRVVPFDTARTGAGPRRRSAALFKHLGQWLRLLGAIVRHRPALVHLHTCSYRTFYRSMADTLAARLLRRPVVLHIHGGYFHEFLSALKGWRRRLVVAHLRAAERIVVLGEVWKMRLAAFVETERIRVVPNGVPFPPRVRTRRRHKLLRVLCVGDLSPGKAAEDLLEAYSRFPPALRRGGRLEFIGGGTPERRSFLEQMIIEKGLAAHVRLLGSQSPERTHAHLRRADIHVLPSRGEGLPMVLLEAMAWGLPSVVTAVGAIPEVVRDGVEAFVIAPGDVPALTERLGRLLTDAELRARMGRAARERVRRAFALDRFHTALERVWGELLCAHGPCPASSVQVP